MRSFGTRGSRSTAGQATVELALLLPLVAVLVLALFQAALVARDQVLVVQAARDAGREIARGEDVSRARDRLARVLPGAELQVTREDGRGAPVRVVVAYTSATALPLVGSLFPDVELTGSVTVAAER